MTDPPQGGEVPLGAGWPPPVPPRTPSPVPRPHPRPEHDAQTVHGPPPHLPPELTTPPYGAPAYAYGPQYAPPQFPPGYGVPPRRRRTGLVWAVVALVVLAVAITVVLSALLRTRVLDPSAVERDVATQFQQLEGVAIWLRCDRSMPLTPGATYRCRGTTADGEQVTLRIQVTDAQRARYTWSEQR